LEADRDLAADFVDAGLAAALVVLAAGAFAAALAVAFGAVAAAAGFDAAFVAAALVVDFAGRLPFDPVFVAMD
jgi:hypothetical protein